MNVQIKLSKRDTFTNMSQVIVRMSITRTIRPQIKTGIYINPDWLKNGKITIPKSGKYNHAG